MEVPGSIPGVRKSLFWVCWEGIFLDFYTCWGMLGDTLERGWGHFLVGSGSLFRHFWDVLGCVWEWSGDLFGWVWEGFGKNVRRGPKINIFKNGRECVA